jgi:hypothetical protein
MQIPRTRPLTSEDWTNSSWLSLMPQKMWGRWWFPSRQIIIIIIISMLIIKVPELVLSRCLQHTPTATKHTEEQRSRFGLWTSRLDTGYTDCGCTILFSAPLPPVSKSSQISPRSLPGAPFLTDAGFTKYPIVWLHQINRLTPNDL